MPETIILDALRRISGVRETIDQAYWNVVDACDEAGISSSQVARAAGVSPQAIRQRRSKRKEHEAAAAAGARERGPNPMDDHHDDEDGLYAILGLTSGATPQEIKAAYRRLAKRHHTDAQAGGDRDAFERIKAAYDVLSDPDKRASYDETGVWAEIGPDDDKDVALSLIVWAFDQVMQGCEAQGQEMVYTEPCAQMWEILTNRLAAAIAAADETRRRRGLLQTSVGGFKHAATGEANMVNERLRHRIGQITKQLIEIEADVRRLAMAQSMLGEYSFKGLETKSVQALFDRTWSIGLTTTA